MEEMIKLQKLNNLSNDDMFNLTIDRINNKGNYTQGNLRLVTQLTQMYNTNIGVNFFTADNGVEQIISNSAGLTAKYLNVVVGAVNNAIGGRSKSCKGFSFKKITKQKYNNLKSVTTKAKIIHKNYE